MTTPRPAAPRPFVLDAHGSWAISLVHAGWLTALASLALSAISVYAIDVAIEPEGHGFHLVGEALKQAMFIAVGAGSAVIVALPHYRWVGRLSWVAMGISVALLIVLILPGVPESVVKPVNGARAWISIGPLFKLQPAELAKIAFVLCTAQYLRFRKSHRKFLGLFPVGLIAVVPLALIMLQPDLGTVILFIPTLFAMLLAAGARLRHLVIIVLVASMGAPVMYPFLKPHQKARIVALIHQIEGNREQGALDINYQSFTAQRLAGSGELRGNTEDHARALIKFNKLPERDNDFIFAIVCARFGLLGGLCVLGLYIVWIGGALLAAAVCKDPFGRLVCVGLAGFIASQVVVNVGMVVGLLPIIGITLPFLSYGGSSMVTVWLMTGLVVSIAMRKPRPPFRPSFEYEDED